MAAEAHNPRRMVGRRLIEPVKPRLLTPSEIRHILKEATKEHTQDVVDDAAVEGLPLTHELFLPQLKGATNLCNIVERMVDERA